MKKVAFVTVFVALLLPTLLFAGDFEGYQQERNITEGTVCISLLSLNTEDNTNIYTRDMKRSGCCSWHGGVCGCRNGRAVCCDGTLSPSCGCD